MKSIRTKLLNLFIFCFLTISFGSCYMYKELPVEYDYSYAGNFKNYNSFSLVDSDNNSEHEFSHLIDNSIVAHMKLLGYELEYKKPDLIISYTIFGDSLHLRGYHQPEMRSWLKTTNRKKSYYPKQLEMYQGTLYLQIFDNKRQQAIWQGYITDKYGKSTMDDKKLIHHAIRSILNEYKVFSQKYHKNKNSI